MNFFPNILYFYGVAREKARFRESLTACECLRIWIGKPLRLVQFKVFDE